MSLSIADVERILNGGQMGRGMAMNQRRQGQRMGSTMTTAQREFLDEVIATSRPAKTKVPQHPAEAARVAPKREEGDLTAVELAWLQRLPLDPSKMPFDAAVELASLAASVSQMSAPASARLVESIWAPVKALHDRRVAESKVALAKERTPSMPARTIEVVLDDLERNHPGIGREALRVQAHDVLSEWTSKQRRDYEDRVSRAEQELREVDERQSQMAEITRETVTA